MLLDFNRAEKVSGLLVVVFSGVVFVLLHGDADTDFFIGSEFLLEFHKGSKGPLFFCDDLAVRLQFGVEGFECHVGLCSPYFGAVGDE